MNLQSGVLLNVATSGFCISEENNVYISKNYIIGFTGEWNNGYYFINILVPGKSIPIYKHVSENLDFKNIAKKIINKLMDSIKYEITINIYIDKIIEEVLNDDKETSDFNK